MALKIRFRKQGRKNHATYRLVVADSSSPRDGRYIENLGHYNPHFEGDNESLLSEERIQYWIDRGAQPTEKASALIHRKTPGILKNLRDKEMAQQKKRSEKRKLKKQA